MAQQNNGRNGGKLSQEKFVLRAIDTLPNGKGKGIHTAYSGLLWAFTRYFGTGPEKAIARSVKAGAIVARETRGGLMLYKAVDAPPPKAQERGKLALARMGLRVKS